MISFTFDNIHDDVTGYEQLAAFYTLLGNKADAQVSLDFCKWFDASMCSPLACALEHLRGRGHHFSLGICDPDIHDLLCKNFFFTEQAFSSTPRDDTWGSTISYQRFLPSQIEDFQDYIIENFPREYLPTMTEKLWERMTDGFLEIFANANQHAEADSVFVCGQYFPHKRRLKFTITDTGIGFQKRILKSRGLTLSPADAIEWGMKGGNTTKKNDPGGVGLNIIKEFIQRNRGIIQVVSHSGYWTMYNHAVKKQPLKTSFPGTAVHITIRTDDPCSYRLASE